MDKEANELLSNLSAKTGMDKKEIHLRGSDLDELHHLVLGRHTGFMAGLIQIDTRVAIHTRFELATQNGVEGVNLILQVAADSRVFVPTRDQAELSRRLPELVDGAFAHTMAQLRSTQDAAIQYGTQASMQQLRRQLSSPGGLQLSADELSAVEISNRWHQAIADGHARSTPVQATDAADDEEVRYGPSDTKGEWEEVPEAADDCSSSEEADDSCPGCGRPGGDLSWHKPNTRAVAASSGDWSE